MEPKCLTTLRLIKKTLHLTVLINDLIVTSVILIRFIRLAEFICSRRHRLPHRAKVIQLSVKR
jgi:hypothetical protein